MVGGVIGVEDVCSVRVSFAVFAAGSEAACDRCGERFATAGGLGVVAQHSGCGHVQFYCESCGMFQCVLSDAEYGDDLASEFLAWVIARRAELN